MTVNYAKHVSTRQTPQSQPIPGKAMVPNSAGGYAFALDDWKRLERFLILGNEGGTYYASEQKLTVENAACVARCAQADPRRTVEVIKEISVAGRAPKNDPAVFALALLAGQQGEASRLALDALPDVCRIGTHLFHFAEAVKAFRGRGRGLRRAFARWYTSKTPDDLAYQVVKYQQRDGWSHRDVLRIGKPKTTDPRLNLVLRWAAGKGTEVAPHHYDEVPKILHAVQSIQSAKDAKQIAKLITDFNVPRECVPTEYLNSPEIWEALLEKMPMTAMIRNLATMTRVGLIAPMSSAVVTIRERLANEEAIRKARVHPIAVLLAHRTYASGHGDKGSNTWSPVPQVVDALDDAFYLAFQSVEPTNRRWLLALDVSGSMGSSRIAGTSLTAREASAAMALTTMNTEPNYATVCFSAGNSPTMHMGYGTAIKPLPLSPRQRLADVVQQVSNLPFGGTDCALPMLYALENGIPVDVFAIYTDSETWAGQVHPCQALQRYREKMGIPAKLVVVGMTSTGFTIADQNDPGQMDVVGFDTSVPVVMNDFVRS